MQRYVSILSHIPNCICLTVSRFAAIKPVGNSATFLADVWLSENTCYNIEFDGQWYSGREYCCGSLPCDLSA
jgi:hypothetical protein